MKFLSQLDDLIKKAVNETFASDERHKQNTQAATVDSLGLHAKKKTQKKEEKDSQEEADEDDADEEKKKDSEKKPEKVKGDPKKVISSEEKEKDEDEKEKKEKPGTQTSKKLQDPSPKELSQPDFKSIAKNINLLRGGKSLKDDDVKKNLKDYIQKLSPDEKKHVLIYLNSLAQVMAGVKSGSEALEPDQTKVSSPKVAKKVSKAKEETPSVPSPVGNSGVIVVGR